jgi:ABC-type polysaccharide/polyol phosphate transport system ATPase subunit
VSSPVQEDVAISVSGLTKTYPVYKSPLDALKEIIPGRKHHVDYPALEGIDFVVRRGERVGIVGANGAGKSTLLKVLSGTVDHSGGSYEITGELRAILELGTGFHEECTGRENILMGGLCLGYSQRELEEHTDWIIDFSELARVIDQPLRTYSSGMKMRLMYSVAFCRPVEVMIIDEALATGDGAFIRKCTNHIVELCGGGTTALIVSHNLYFLERICHRVIYLKDGKVVADGDPLTVCKLYEKDLGRDFVDGGEGAGSVSEFVRDEAGEKTNPLEELTAAAPIIAGGVHGDESVFVDDRPLSVDMLESGGGPGRPDLSGANGPGEIIHQDGRVEPFDFSGAPAVLHRGLVKLLEARLFNEMGEPVTEMITGSPCRMRFVFESQVRKPDVHLGFMIWNDRNEHVATTTNVCSLDGRGRSNAMRVDLIDGIFSIDVVFPSLRLGSGAYFLKFGVSPGTEHFSDDDLLLSENRCLAFVVARPDHVQTVVYEPHSVWSPLKRLAAKPPSAPGETAPSEAPVQAGDVQDVAATPAPSETSAAAS